MFCKTLTTALAASLVAGVAIPNKAPVDIPHNVPLEKRVTPYVPTTPYSRLNPTYTQDQLNELKLAYTQVERMQLLNSYGSQDDYFKFDLTPAGFTSNAGNGQGGQGYLAAVQNFPVLMGTGLSLAIGYLTPCGLDSMHIHNRATEMVVLVKGESLHTGFQLEDGFTTSVATTIGLYQAAIRPQGAIHYEFNDHCEPAVFVAGLSSEDPGVARTANLLFENPPDVLKADFGFPKFLDGVNITEFAADIPSAFALGAAACLKRCGLTYNATEH